MSLFPDDNRPTRQKHPRAKKARTRHQYRRKAWEDYCEATLFALSLFADEQEPILGAETEATVELPAAALWDWNDELDEVVKAARARRVEFYRARHEKKTPIHRPKDAQRPIDFGKAITGLARMFREEILAVDGVRFAAKGVHRVRPNDPGSPYRAQPWCQRQKKHVHVGYFATEGQAWDAVRKWYEENENVDGIVEVPKGSAMEALMGLIREALESQAVTAADAHRKRWGDDLPDDE